MAGFQLTEEQKSKKANYANYGWPEMVTTDDLVFFMGLQWLTIQKYYANRPDWPVRKIADTWSVPLEVWRAFLSAVYTGQVFMGFKDVDYIKSDDEGR